MYICNVMSPEKIYVQWLLTENLLNRYNIQGKHLLHIILFFFCISFLEDLEVTNGEFQKYKMISAKHSLKDY